MRPLSFFLAVLLSLVCALGPARAQQHPNVAQGFNPSASFAAGDVDNVNLFNGNLVIRIPLGQTYPVNGGLSYGLTLVYNSQVWEQQTYSGVVQSLPYRTSNAGLGWTLSLGRLNAPYVGELEATRDTYMSPDGARHTFYPTLHEGETATPDIFYTRDGTYLRYQKSLNLVEFPDGTIHTFDAAGSLIRITDPFGNAVNICTTCCPTGTCTTADEPWPWRITDAHGREHWVWFRATGHPYQPVVVDRVEMDSFGTQPTAVYTFRYNLDEGGPQPMKGCRNQDTATQDIPVVLLTRLTLPDGSSYQMPEYFNTPAGLCKTGMIRKLVLPTLGSIEYDYINYQYPSGSTGRSFWQFTTGVGTRTLRDELGAAAGTWTYSTALPAVTTPRELVNSVTDPLGHRVARYFSVGTASTTEKSEYGLPFSRQQPGDGAGRFLSSQVFHQDGRHLRSTYLRYESDLGPTTWGADIQDWTRLDQRQASQRTVFHDDGGKVADETLSDFDGHGHYRGRSTGGTFPGSNSRASVVGYNGARGTYGQAGYTPWPTGSPWLLGTYSFAWDSENGQLQYRSFCFDAKGFLLGRRIHAMSSASYSTNDQVEVFARDTVGNLTSEKYFGGDTQAITADPTQGFICTLVNSLTSPVYQIDHGYTFGVRSTTSTTTGGNPLYTLNQTIDRSTGLPSSSSDIADRQTSYTFDNLGRITQIQPPQGAATTYTWRRATSASSMARVTVAQTLSGVTYTESRTDFDGFGRPAVEEERMPDNSWADRRIAYNALGWKTSVSERGSPYGTLFADYDPFGRPGRIVPPDLPGHTVTLTYAGTSQVTRQIKVATGATAESTVDTAETYDRYGRLHEVKEPNGVLTHYEYDTGNHLKRVCQGFNPANSTCGQERLFTWDNRGLLLWENHPEKTANRLGQGHDVDYLGYDARGHATRKVDGANDLTFVYDKLERLTQIRQTGAGACVTVQNTGPLCLKSFTYATANGTATGGLTDSKRGKLTAASRYNYVGPPFSATVEVKETWQYAGRGGRMSQQDTALIFNGTQNEVFRQTFSWNEIGDLASHTYPDCATPERCGTAPRTQSYGYTKGRLTSVAGFASSIIYHPSGMMARVVRSNGLTDYQSADPSGMARPAEIYTLRTSDGLGLWSTGAYSYDGSGNVWKTGNALYLYDSLSRVTSGKVYPGPFSGGTASTQSYTYDNYGNLTGTTTGGVLVNSPASTATNRLTGGTYDAAGNLTGWSGNTYEYDAFDQMTRLVSGADDWRYMYTAGDERFWSYRAAGGSGSVWTLRGPGSQVLREYNAHLGWDNYRDSIYRGSTLLATVASPSAGGTVSHQHTDHLGTPRLITDAAGNPATKQYHAYYPYGQELATTYTTAYPDRQRFTGHERDLVNLAGQGDDLDYMHARHYSPVLGRFLSVDPRLNTKRASTLPQGWNRYTYVESNPLRFADVDGQELGLDVNMLAGANETPAQSMAMGGAAGILAAGLVLAPEALLVAVPLAEATTALGVKYQNIINLLRDIGAGLTGAPSVSNPIAGDFEQTFSVKGESIVALASASTKGTTLILDDFAIYADKAKAAVGPGALKGLISQLRQDLQRQGYTKLIIKGVRYSGAKPGRTATIVISIPSSK